MTPQTTVLGLPLISRSDARNLGKTRYFTGVTCVHGHISERSVSNGTCLICHAIKKRQHYMSNKDHFSDYCKRRRSENKDQLKVKARDYYERNKEKIRLKQKEYSRVNSKTIVVRVTEWGKRNPDSLNARTVVRRANRLDRMPLWYGEFDEFVWREAARLVRSRSEITGIKWHADHIVPLSCRTASGFHSGANCQVIPAKLNIRKSNKLILTTSSEWINRT